MYTFMWVYFGCGPSLAKPKSPGNVTQVFDLYYTNVEKRINKCNFTDFGFHIFVKQNISTLDITMYKWFLAHRMKKLESSRSATCDV